MEKGMIKVVFDENSPSHRHLYRTVEWLFENNLQKPTMEITFHRGNVIKQVAMPQDDFDWVMSVEVECERLFDWSQEKRGWDFIKSWRNKHIDSLCMNWG